MDYEANERELISLYEELQPIITSLYNKYKYLNLTIKEFEILCKTIIKQSYDKNRNMPVKKHIEKLKNKLNRYSKSVENDIEQLIKTVINEIKVHESVEQNIKELTKIIDFFYESEIEQNPEIYTKLLKNPIINSILTQIVTKRLDDIQTIGLESIDSNKNIQLLLEIYCEINQINYKNIEFETFVDEYNYNEDANYIDGLGLYLSQISKQLLTKEEQERLFILKDRGNKRAKEILIEHNLQLVVYLAKKYYRKGIDLLDLIQEGNIGLISAIEKFDYKKGYKLSTYATWWIKQSIQRGIVNSTKTIRLPENFYNKLTKYIQVIEQLEKRLLRKPTTEEICNEMNINMEQLKLLEKSSQNIVSINTLVKYDGETETELGELLASDDETLEEQYIKSNLRQEVDEILDKINLTERELFVLRERNGMNGENPKTLEEIAKVIGVTKERIRQIESRALSKIRMSPYIVKLASLAELPEEQIRTFIDFYYSENHRIKNKGRNKK